MDNQNKFFPLLVNLQGTSGINVGVTNAAPIPPVILFDKENASTE